MLPLPDDLITPLAQKAHDRGSRCTPLRSSPEFVQVQHPRLRERCREQFTPFQDMTACYGGVTIGASGL
jgi:hypothetical protein